MLSPLKTDAAKAIYVGYTNALKACLPGAGHPDQLQH